MQPASRTAAAAVNNVVILGIFISVIVIIRLSVFVEFDRQFDGVYHFVVERDADSYAARLFKVVFDDVSRARCDIDTLRC